MLLKDFTGLIVLLAESADELDGGGGVAVAGTQAELLG